MKKIIILILFLTSFLFFDYGRVEAACSAASIMSQVGSMFVSAPDRVAGYCTEDEEDEDDCTAPPSNQVSRTLNTQDCYGYLTITVSGVLSTGGGEWWQERSTPAAEVYLTIEDRTSIYGYVGYIVGSTDTGTLPNCGSIDFDTTISHYIRGGLQPTTRIDFSYYANCSLAHDHRGHYATVTNVDFQPYDTSCPAGSIGGSGGVLGICLLGGVSTETIACPTGTNATAWGENEICINATIYSGRTCGNGVIDGTDQVLGSEMCDPGDPPSVPAKQGICVDNVIGKICIPAGQEDECTCGQCLTDKDCPEHKVYCEGNTEITVPQKCINYRCEPNTERECGESGWADPPQYKCLDKYTVGKLWYEKGCRQQMCHPKEIIRVGGGDWIEGCPIVDDVECYIPPIGSERENFCKNYNPLYPTPCYCPGTCVEKSIWKDQDPEDEKWVGDCRDCDIYILPEWEGKVDPDYEPPKCGSGKYCDKWFSTGGGNFVSGTYAGCDFKPLPQKNSSGVDEKCETSYGVMQKLRFWVCGGNRPDAKCTKKLEWLVTEPCPNQCVVSMIELKTGVKVPEKRCSTNEKGTPAVQQKYNCSKCVTEAFTASKPISEPFCNTNNLLDKWNTVEEGITQLKNYWDLITQGLAARQVPLPEYWQFLNGKIEQMEYKQNSLDKKIEKIVSEWSTLTQWLESGGKTESEITGKINSLKTELNGLKSEIDSLWNTIKDFRSVGGYWYSYKTYLENKYNYLVSYWEAMNDIINSLDGYQLGFLRGEAGSLMDCLASIEGEIEYEEVPSGSCYRWEEWRTIDVCSGPADLLFFCWGKDIYKLEIKDDWSCRTGPNNTAKCETKFVIYIPTQWQSCQGFCCEGGPRVYSAFDGVTGTFPKCYGNCPTGATRFCDTNSTQLNSLNITCDATPNPVDVFGVPNQPVTFGVTSVTGGRGNYTFSWSGDCQGTGSTCTKYFPQWNKYTATVTVDSFGQTASANCSVNVGYTLPAVNAYCIPSSNPVDVNQEVSFVPVAKGGYGPGTYTYSWGGVCSGSDPCLKSFSSPGKYTATVSVTSGVDTATNSCTVDVSESGIEICDYGCNWGPCSKNQLPPSQNPPTVDGLTALPETYCIGVPGCGEVSFEWTYSDEDGDTQSRLDMQISSVPFPDTGDECPLCEVNRTFSGLSNPSGSTNTQIVNVLPVATSPGGNHITFGKSYYVRVRVWDSAGLNSGWVQYFDENDSDGDGNKETFTKAPFPPPYPNFSFVPSPAQPEENIAFNDNSICYTTGNVSYPCKEDNPITHKKNTYRWLFGDNTENNDVGDTSHSYAAVGIYPVTLEICDDYLLTRDPSKACCHVTYNVPVRTVRTGSGGVPLWKEISPFEK